MAENCKGVTDDLINILVKTFTGKTISLKVDSSDTIGSMKLEISGKTGIPIDQQAEVFNETVLEDMYTFANLSINKESTFTVLKSRVLMMEIFVKTHTGETIGLKVTPLDTIEKVKGKIERQVHIPLDEQALNFNEMVLEDCGSLFDFHINNGSTLTRMPKSNRLMEIFIKTPFYGLIIDLKLKPTVTVGKVKSMIRFQAGMYPDEQTLIFNEMVLDDNRSLMDLHIKGGATLTLKRKSKGLMNIFIKTPNGEIITFEVKFTDTISKVKSMIESRVGSISKQALIFDEMVLEDTCTLVYLNIINESTLSLMRKSIGLMEIFLEPLPGHKETIALKVKPSETVRNLKAKIEDMVVISPDQYRLIFDGHNLKNNFYLADYNVHNNSTLSLLIYLRG